MLKRDIWDSYIPFLRQSAILEDGKDSGEMKR